MRAGCAPAATRSWRTRSSARGATTSTRCSASRPAARTCWARSRRTRHHHCPWANDGSGYDHPRALALARRHAADFVAHTKARLERARARAPAGAPASRLAVCALDTELLGHWWYEGIAWLEAVVEE